MTAAPFTLNIAVGPALVVIQEVRVEDHTRVLSVTSSGLSRELSFLSFYEPRAVATPTAIGIWGGTRLYTIRPSSASICLHDSDTDIIAVFAIADRFVVVSETAADLMDSNCRVAQTLLTNDDVILEARLEDRRLIVRDLQNRNRSVDIPA